MNKVIIEKKGIQLAILPIELKNYKKNGWKQVKDIKGDKK